MTRPKRRSFLSFGSRRPVPSRSGGLTGRRSPIGHRVGLEGLEPRALLAGDLLAAISAGDRDAWEFNDTISQATVLGSDPHVLRNNLTITSDEGGSDVDFFRIVAPFTGSLTVTTFFDNSQGNLDLAIVDRSGDIIATSNSNDDDELITIPVVKGNSYYAVVTSPNDDDNVYSLDVLMSQAPAPFYVGLDSGSDTGRSNSDGVTLATTPRFLVQSDLLGIEGVPVLTSLQANSGTAPGAALEVVLTRVTDGSQVKGYADRLGTSELYAFRPTTALGEGRYLLWAHWEIRDGQNAGTGGPTPAIGNGPSTGSTRIEIDTVNPTGSGPLLGNASDTGGSTTDHVTNKDQPFFVGIGEPGAIVRLFANGTLVGETVAQSDGRWEITSEPLRDNVYDFTVQYEDLSGRVTEIETSTRVEVDTLAPNTPYLDLVDSSDTGHSSIDNITSDNTPTLTMTTTDPNTDIHVNEFNYKFRIYLRPERNADGSVGQEVLIYDSSTDPTIPAADKDADGFTSLSLLMTTITNALPDGVNNLKLEVEDRAGNISPDYLLTIEVDTTPVPPVNIDMLTSSDSGGVDTDNITNKDMPAFTGRSKPMSTVLLFANGQVVGQTVVQSDASDVGIVPGATANDGLGLWEITSEPLDDGVYSMVARVEDWTSNVADSNPLVIEVDTLAPNTPYLDLVDSSDTGHSSIDNITSDNTPTLTMTTTDPNSDIHVNEFNYKFRIYLRPERNADGSVGQEVLIYDSSTDATIPAADKDAAGFTSLSLLMTTIANAIPDGVNNLKLEVEDRAGNISPDYLLTIEVDTTPVPPVNLDMLTSSDSGVVDSDNVTNKDMPAFTGRSKPMSTVLLFANGEMVGQTVVQSDASDVGIVPGATDNDGLGLWEITSEPLDDGVYSMVARVEDWTAHVVDSNPLVIEVDTLAPNTPALDLLESSDTGRNNDDDITAAALLDFSMTTTDPLAANHLTLFPGGQNLLYRLYDRPENGTEVLIYSSATDASIPNQLDGLTSANRVTANDLNLSEGLHNLKLEVEDRAGNISHDFLFTLLVDRTSPPGAGNLSPDSDTGIWGAASTLNDRITADPTPSFLGTAEANAIVSATIDGVPVGTAVAIPLSGDDAFQPPTDPYNVQGNWAITSGVNLSEGEHTVVFTYEDPAGNRSTSQLQIFVDTTGPRIINVTRNDATFTSLFQPKPAGGPDPLLNSIVIHVNDSPARTAAFAYPAIVAQLAQEEGNFRLVGDANGNIPIVDVNLLTSTTGPGNATMQIQLVFAQPLPDDRYTLTVLDTLADPAGNALDGESGATAPFEGNNGLSDTPPIFPTGDGQHGGSFHARFTVDSRPEIGVWAAGSVWVDTNGNFQLDPTNVDYVNRDIIYKLEFTSDDIFAGNFAAAGATADGFDKLAAYGRFNGAFRWLVDLTNDGVPDVNVVDGRNINGLPVAGQFDSSAANGDEVGVFDGSTWYFDTNHDWHVDYSLSTSMTGYPVVGDFDGDGFDDLGTWTDDRFQLDLAKGGLRGWDGSPDVTFRYGFIGVRERPVAADMDQDGFEDLGLWVPDRQGTTPVRHSEWYWLISGGRSLITRVSAAENPISGLPEIDFTPAPFGQDKFAIYGDGFALPIVGNFDPPVVPKPSASGNSSASNGSTGATAGNSGTSGSGTASSSGGTIFSPLDTNQDGQISPSDALLVLNNLNAKGGRKLTAQDNLRVDTNRDGYVSPLDVLLVINELNKISRPANPAPAPAPTPAPEDVDAALVEPSASSSSAINQQAVAAALGSPAVDAAYDSFSTTTTTKRKVVG